MTLSNYYVLRLNPQLSWLFDGRILYHVRVSNCCWYHVLSGKQERETVRLVSNSLFDRHGFKSIGVSPKIVSIVVISLQRSVE